jgi:imidazole glycerol-phosphate synthase subunit HisH
VTAAIIDYGSGNLRSASKALELAARRVGSGEQIVVTNDPDVVRRADHVVLPGVGAFKDCREGLAAIPGMIEAMEESIHREGRPFLGVCVGMQLLATRGLEHETTSGLDWIAGDVALIETSEESLKIPHMGWNTIDLARSHPVFEGIETGDAGLHAYFVHSYHFIPKLAADVLATAQYGIPFAAAVARDTIVGTQFHPEKSQRLGLALLANFLRWRP